MFRRSLSMPDESVSWPIASNELKEFTKRQLSSRREGQRWYAIADITRFQNDPDAVRADAVGAVKDVLTANGVHEVALHC